MNKLTNIVNWAKFLIIAILVFAGCDTVIKKQSSVTTVPYLHYTPTKKFNVHLEFDYPSSFPFYERRKAEDIVAISLDDPRFLTLPTPAPPDYHPTPNDYGYILIWITENKPGQTPESEIEELKRNYGKILRITILNDYEITIDGYKAHVLEYQDSEPLEGYPALMFNRRIFFNVKDQMYQIHFSVAENDRGGEFEQGYEVFFNSLEITP